jgi:hypothetical protein
MWDLWLRVERFRVNSAGSFWCVKARNRLIALTAARFSIARIPAFAGFLPAGTKVHAHVHAFHVKTTGVAAGLVRDGEFEILVWYGSDLIPISEGRPSTGRALSHPYVRGQPQA